MARTGSWRERSSERSEAVKRRPSKPLAAALTMTRSTGPPARGLGPPHGADLGLFGIALDHRAVLDAQLGGDALGLAFVDVDDQHPAAQAIQASGGAGDHAHAAARGLALAQFVDHELEAGQAAHAREQHDVVDGLGQKVRGARFQALDTIGAAVEGRDQHHRDVAGDRVFLELAADGEAVHAGHHDVQQDDVGQVARGHGQGRRAVHGAGDFVVLGRQLGLEQADIGLDVVDDEDPGAHAAGTLSSRRLMVSRKWTTEMGLEM
jgi:hypothetical protein